jgi:hypothetical protein
LPHLDATYTTSLTGAKAPAFPRRRRPRRRRSSRTRTSPRCGGAGHRHAERPTGSAHPHPPQLPRSRSMPPSGCLPPTAAPMVPTGLSRYG